MKEYEPLPNRTLKSQNSDIEAEPSLTVKIDIIESEWFPCYEVYEASTDDEEKSRWKCAYDISTEAFYKIKEIEKEFDEIQEKLFKIFHNDKKE